MANRLNNKIAIVTGGNSGIGEATAHLFATEGAKVAIMARREEEGLKVQDAITGKGGEATFIACDVGDGDSVEAAVAKAAKIYGAIHILFNNAGGGGGGEVSDRVQRGMEPGHQCQSDRHVLRLPRCLAASRGSRRRRRGEHVLARRPAGLQPPNVRGIQHSFNILLRGRKLASTRSPDIWPGSAESTTSGSTACVPAKS